MSGIKDAKQRRERKKKQRRIRLMVCSFLVLIIGIAAVVSGTNLLAPPLSNEDAAAPQQNDDNQKKKRENADAAPITIEKAVIGTNQVPSKDPVTLTVSSMGDCTLGTDVNFDPSKSLNAYYSAQGSDYFFQNVRPILEADDLSIVNMEGTLTMETVRVEKTYAFKGAPEYASILSGGSVELANLANNHSRDYGGNSYTDTIANLSNAGIKSFGYERVLLLNVKGVKVGITGIYELADHEKKAAQVKDNIAALKNAGAALIIVNFHWGSEREHTPSNTQQTLAHLAIDKGADLVVGHHPHVLQGVEKYKGRYIAYSLGNFCFGGNNNPLDKDTMIFQQTFTIQKGTVKKDDAIQMIPCSISTAGSYNDYCPTPLAGAEKERVLKRIEDYSANL